MAFLAAVFQTNERELAKSAIICAPVKASFSPSPVMVLTRVFGTASTVGCLFRFSFATTFGPIESLPPIATILMATSRTAVSRQNPERLTTDDRCYPSG